MSCENVTIGTGEKGCRTAIKQDTTILFFEDAKIFDIASLQDKTALASLVYDNANRMSILHGANYMEPTPAEAEFHTPDYGSKEKIGEKPPVKLFKFKYTECVRKLFNQLDGSTAHILLVTENDFINGVAIDNDKLKTAKVSLNVTDEVIDGKVEYKNLEISFATLYDNEKRYIDLGYDINEVENLKGLYIYPKTASTTEVGIEVNDCGFNAIDGIDTGNFVVTNKTTEAVVTTTWTDNNDGSYTGAYTAGVTAGDVLEVSYTGASSTNLFIQILTSNISAS